MSELVNLLISGVATGCIYGLAALGLNIIFKPTNVINLAQGQFIVVGMAVGSVLLLRQGLPWIVGLVAVVLAGAAVATVTDRVAVTPLLKRSLDSHGWLISTLAISMIMTDVLTKMVGSDPLRVPPLPGLSQGARDFGPFRAQPQALAVIVVTILAVAAVHYFYTRTRSGRAITATAEDRLAATLCGMNPTRLTSLSFLLAGAVAGLTGLLAAPFLSASVSVGIVLLLKGFMAFAIGGAGSSWGAVVGGVLVGILEAFSLRWYSATVTDAVLLGVLLVVLMIKPGGLFAGIRLRSV